ncbi:MAG: hypothetical protein II625_05355 [Bacilli bacterium]|nr:hypothetical protein [Bacilli bacterium]
MATRSTVIDDTKYTCDYDLSDSGGLKYRTLTDDVRAIFDFLKVDIPGKLDEAANYINEAAAITDAFYFENGSSVQDISEAATKLNSDINDLKTGLTTLHQAFMADIDQVNAELEYNFGWVVIGKASGVTRKKKIENEG